MLYYSCLHKNSNNKKSHLSPSPLVVLVVVVVVVVNDTMFWKLFPLLPSSDRSHTASFFHHCTEQGSFTTHKACTQHDISLWLGCYIMW
jgi:hypothetical protein